VTPEETRERLVDAAARVFELKGYEGATVALIAREAGVTTGAIYVHYASKAELLVDALRVHSERATASLLPTDRRPNAAAMLVTLGSRLQRRDERSTALLTEALLAARRDAELAQVLAAALGARERRTAGLLAESQGVGDITDELSAAAGARFALMVGLGSMLVSSLDIPPVDEEEWKALIRRVVGALVADDG
jgi:AcrR family transcriptional regulator